MEGSSENRFMATSKAVYQELDRGNTGKINAIYLKELMNKFCEIVDW